MAFDVAHVRGLYPTLASEIAQLEGSYSGLMPETVVRAIITTLRSAPTQPGSQSARSQRTAASVLQARRAVADLLNGPADGVMLGPNVSTLLASFVDMASQDWRLGDEIVLSRLDHDANVRPWLRAAQAVGAIVRWAEVDVETGELPDWQYEKLINRRTRVVTVPLGNPATGSIPATAQISKLAHDVGALVVVDAGATLPHMPIDIQALDADVVSLSANSFGGPTLGIVATRHGLLSEMRRPGSHDEREGYEFGSLPVELIDGLTAAVDHLAGLDDTAIGNRRDRLVTSLTVAGEYQSRLFAVAQQRLRRLRGVTLLGPSQSRLPVAGFTVANRHPDQVGAMLYDRGVSVWTGNNGLSQLMESTGANEIGGLVHFGVMPHTTHHELDLLVDALSEIAWIARPGS